MGRRRKNLRLTDQDVRVCIETGNTERLHRALDLSDNIVIQINPVFKQTLIALITHNNWGTISEFVRSTLEDVAFEIPGWGMQYQQTLIEFYEEQLERNKKII